MNKTKVKGIDINLGLSGYRLMCIAKSMAELYESKFRIVSKYVHATSRGHEAIQLAVGMQLKPQDYVWPYYRDESMLLGMGFTAYDLMLQLLAKAEDPFSAGRTYYAHPSWNLPDKPKIPHQSSATGMQAIPATGAALGLLYKEKTGFFVGRSWQENPLVVCSLGDAAVTEGEVSEAFHMAALKQLPILFLVQDNGWNISATAEEIRNQNAAEYASGFIGLESLDIDGANFEESFETVKTVLKIIRQERRPFLIRASTLLLNHHTSGVRMEWYRDDLEFHQERDPVKRLRAQLLDLAVPPDDLTLMEQQAANQVSQDFEKAMKACTPHPHDLYTHVFAPTPILEEKGVRVPDKGERKTMVDCALHAVEEVLRSDTKVLFFGQDVGKRLGGVFREAATLAEKFGENRVFNTPIQEAFIIGSTVGISAVGLKPIVEIQFADYLWPGLNQLFSEVSRSCYLSNGKWPVGCIIRVPTGAYGSGGPYHSSSLETVVCNIRGIKIAYPSNGADLKGLIKAAYHDPNPVLIFEHKGLYWSKSPHTEGAKVVEPSADYILPFGLGKIVLPAEKEKINTGKALLVVTYGMGVHWALAVSKNFPGKITVLDLRTLHPLDEALIYEESKNHGKILVLTEEVADHSFAQALAGRIQDHCFEYLDAPVKTLGSKPLPAIPLNEILEKEMLPSLAEIKNAFEKILSY